MLLGWQDRVRDLDGYEQRCRLRQFQLPTEQDTHRDPIAARYLRQAGSRPRRLLDDPAFIRLAKRPRRGMLKFRSSDLETAKPCTYSIGIARSSEGIRRLSRKRSRRVWTNPLAMRCAASRSNLLDLAGTTGQGQLSSSTMRKRTLSIS